MHQILQDAENAVQDSEDSLYEETHSPNIKWITGKQKCKSCHREMACVL